MTSRRSRPGQAPAQGPPQPRAAPHGRQGCRWLAHCAAPDSAPAAGLRGQSACQLGKQDQALACMRCAWARLGLACVQVSLLQLCSEALNRGLGVLNQRLLLLPEPARHRSLMPWAGIVQPAWLMHAACVPACGQPIFSPQPLCVSLLLLPCLALQVLTALVLIVRQPCESIS